MSPLEEEIQARLCVHCSDPLEEPDPENGRDMIVLPRRFPAGFAHGSCEWQDRLAEAGAA